MNTIITQMIQKYDDRLPYNRDHVVKEIMQEMVLCGLSRAGFFKEAAFYGGTALRIFYEMDRFSENLDFSLQSTNDHFDLSEYFPILEKEIQAFGLHLEVSEKIKSIDSDIKSAFLKGNTKEHYLLFYGDNDISGIHPGEKIRIKFEVDTNPPEFAQFEHKYRLLPSPYEITLYDAPSLFAGKIHAVLCRSWKNRVKGRDLYDYVFFLSRSTPVNLLHLQSRLRQNGYLAETEHISLPDLKNRLSEHFQQINYVQAIEDVKPFIRNRDALSVWSSDFFTQIADQLTAR